MGALPLSKYPLFNVQSSLDAAQSTQTLAPYFLDWLSHPTYDSYWKQWSIEERYASIQVPALTIAAWYDIFQGGSLRNYEGLRDHAGNAASRKEQRLMVVIGGHAIPGRKIGSVDFGEAAGEFSENDAILSWFDYLLRGEQERIREGKACQDICDG